MTGTQTWVVLTQSTNNDTTYVEGNFKTGTLYYFKIVPWNDFGQGLFNSTAFGVWAAIPPSGLSPPSTTLNYVSYTLEDDIVIIDWNPPSDDGGLTVTYSVEILTRSGTWLLTNMNTECNELTQITPYHLPLIAGDSVTRCTILVTNLKSKYGLQVGDTVQARITATQPVGSVTSSAGGTAVLPVVPCFRTTFPRVIGGTDDETMILAMDVDDKGHIVVGGYSKDKGVMAKSATMPQKLPFAAYIAKGNYIAWGKYIETSDSGGSLLYEQILDVAFRFDGEKVALALERQNYDM